MSRSIARLIIVMWDTARGIPILIYAESKRLFFVEHNQERPVRNMAGKPVSRSETARFKMR